METGTWGFLHQPGSNCVSTREEGAQHNARRGRHEGAQGNYYYNMQQKEQGDREWGEGFQVSEIHEGYGGSN